MRNAEAAMKALSQNLEKAVVPEGFGVHRDYVKMKTQPRSKKRKTVRTSDDDHVPYQRVL